MQTVFTETQEVTDVKRICTFSISHGEAEEEEMERGGGVLPLLNSEKMQVVNVPVSSKNNKSNQVSSGTATISWLFEPSGPSSSEL